MDPPIVTQGLNESRRQRLLMVRYARQHSYLMGPSFWQHTKVSDQLGIPSRRRNIRHFLPRMSRFGVAEDQAHGTPRTISCLRACSVDRHYAGMVFVMGIICVLEARVGGLHPFFQ